MRLAAFVTLSIGLWIAHIAILAVAGSDPASMPSLLTVTKLTDTNDGRCDTDCSLREAIAVSTSNGTINFAQGLTGTITLRNTLNINKNVQILGPLSEPITISGNHAVRVFYVKPEVHFTIKNLTIANGEIKGKQGILGKSGARKGENVGGGGLCNNEGIVTIINCTFSRNKALGGVGAVKPNVNGKEIIAPNGASNGGSGLGGALFSTGTLYLINSTFSDNKAVGGIGSDSLIQPGKGGNGLGGAIYSTDTTWVVNCTFSGNGAYAGLGGTAIETNAFADFRGTTIEINSSVTQLNGHPGMASGGAIYRPGALPDKYSLTMNRGGIITIKNSIITNSSNGGNCDASIKSEGYNLDSDGTCRLRADGDLSNINPNLDSLKNNGGPSFTHALMPGSPAIDGGNPAGCTDNDGIALLTDQRGYNRVHGTACDIGSFEFSPGQ
jgi:CSLREA domain-containing protein